MFEDGTDRRIEELFVRHIKSNRMLDDIDALKSVLPDDAAVLRGLAARCFAESRNALHAGHHLEGRRLDVLGWKLQQRASQTAMRGY